MKVLLVPSTCPTFYRNETMVDSSSSLHCVDLEMSTDIICQLAYDGKLDELQTKLKTDLKLACKKFQVGQFFCFVFVYLNLNCNPHYSLIRKIFLNFHFMKS